MRATRSTLFLGRLCQICLHYKSLSLSWTSGFQISQYLYRQSHNGINLHETANVNHTPDFSDASDSDTDLMALEDSACEDHETDSVGTGRNGNGATQIVRMAP